MANREKRMDKAAPKRGRFIVAEMERREVEAIQQREPWRNFQRFDRGDIVEIEYRPQDAASTEVTERVVGMAGRAARRVPVPALLSNASQHRGPLQAKAEAEACEALLHARPCGHPEIPQAVGGQRAQSKGGQLSPRWLHPLTRVPPTSRHKVGGGGISVSSSESGVLSPHPLPPKRKKLLRRCGPMAQIAAILLRKASGCSGIQLERKIRPFANRPADVAKGGVWRVTRHTELAKLGLGPVEGGDTHNVSERRSDGSGRSRRSRKQRCHLRKIGPAPPPARPIGESLIFAARDALQVHRLAVLRTLHPAPNDEDEGGVTAVGEELCPLHVLHPNRKPRAKKEGAGEETHNRILRARDQTFQVKIKARGKSGRDTLASPRGLRGMGRARHDGARNLNRKTTRCSTKNLSDERKLSPTAVAPPREPTPAFFARWCSPEIRAMNTLGTALTCLK
eukprot:scaffold30041_cov107-Isochrysis_galbana.AAC.6